MIHFRPELLAMMNMPIAELGKTSLSDWLVSTYLGSRRLGKTLDIDRVMRQLDRQYTTAYPSPHFYRYAQDWLQENMVYGNWPHLDEYVRYRSAQEVRRIEPDRSKAWAGREYPRELIGQMCIDTPWTIDGMVVMPGQRWLLTNQSDAARNGVYFTDLKVGTLSQVTYTSEGGWRVNGQAVSRTENWIGTGGWFANRWNHYRLYPNPPVASGTRRSK